jgi:hypothetical protein
VGRELPDAQPDGTFREVSASGCGPVGSGPCRAARLLGLGRASRAPAPRSSGSEATVTDRYGCAPAPPPPGLAPGPWSQGKRSRRRTSNPRPSGVPGSCSTGFAPERGFGLARQVLARSSGSRDALHWPRAGRSLALRPRCSGEASAPWSWPLRSGPGRRRAVRLRLVSCRRRALRRSEAAQPSLRSGGVSRFRRVRPLRRSVGRSRRRSSRGASGQGTARASDPAWLRSVAAAPIPVHPSSSRCASSRGVPATPGDAFGRGAARDLAANGFRAGRRWPRWLSGAVGCPSRPPGRRGQARDGWAPARNPTSPEGAVGRAEGGSAFAGWPGEGTTGQVPSPTDDSPSPSPPRSPVRGRRFGASPAGDDLVGSRHPSGCMVERSGRVGSGSHFEAGPKLRRGAPKRQTAFRGKVGCGNTSAARRRGTR